MLRFASLFIARIVRLDNFRSAPARYAESSMSNGFGLKFLHKWFNLPFLQLQRQTLLAQLETNENEIVITTQELDLYQQTDDSNYKVYVI